jgi:hypothetical protein
MREIRLGARALLLLSAAALLVGTTPHGPSMGSRLEDSEPSHARSHGGSARGENVRVKR